MHVGINWVVALPAFPVAVGSASLCVLVRFELYVDYPWKC